MISQIFIKVIVVKDGVVSFINKDIRESTYEERVKYYHSISKGMVITILERSLNNNKKGGFINE